MYWSFFYKILSLIDPETSHNLVIKIIKNGFLPKIKTKLNPLNSSLLISQLKIWLEKKEYNEIKNLFSFKR